MTKKKNISGVVYSTNPDFQFQPDEKKEPANLRGNKQDLRVWLEYHGGKATTIIRDFVGATSELEKLGKELKIKCGVGGSVKDRIIIIQGNQREKVMKLLAEMGYRAKKAGG